MTYNNGCWTCIKCGNKWGNGTDVSSSGICPKCFSEYVNDKKAKNGYVQCFGQFYSRQDVDCSTCSLNMYCKNYYDYLKECCSDVSL